MTRGTVVGVVIVAARGRIFVVGVEARAPQRSRFDYRFRSASKSPNALYVKGNKQ